MASRDEFLNHFKKYLTKRLLNNLSKDFEAEKTFISKLKLEAGIAIRKIETMV